MPFICLSLLFVPLSFVGLNSEWHWCWSSTFFSALLTRVRKIRSQRFCNSIWVSQLKSDQSVTLKHSLYDYILNWESHKHNLLSVSELSVEFGGLWLGYCHPELNLEPVTVALVNVIFMTSLKVIRNRLWMWM